MSKPVQYDHKGRPTVLHPYNVFLTLFLAGITMLFLALTASYIYTRIQMEIPPIELPPLFIINTIILVASSYTMKLANDAYKADNTEKYIQSLVYTIALSLVFMLSQGVAWTMLFKNNIPIAYSTTASYLYVISFLHFAHVIAGIPFLLLFIRAAKTRMKDPVSVLVYFSDPEKKIKLKLLTSYWHFLDILWIYLVVFFYLNYLIS